MKLLRPIQYLRGVAALLVAAYHSTNQVAGTSDFVNVAFGPSGVDLFFVISGFIMVVTTGAMGPVEFMRRRIVRVVPLYWVLTLAMIVLALLAPGLFKTLRFSAETVLKSLLFVPHESLSFAGALWPVLVPGWTLNYEMFFYVLFALSMPLSARWRLGVLLASLGLLVGAGFLFGPFAGAAASTYTSPLLLGFAAGVALAWVWQRGGLALPVPVSLLALVLGGVLMVARDAAPFHWANQMVGAALVVGGALNPRFGGWRNGLLQALGDASYSIYLTHIFTLGALRVVWSRLLPGPIAEAGTAALFVAVALLACAVVGWLTYRWVEQPLLARLNRRPPRPVPAG